MGIGELSLKRIVLLVLSVLFLTSCGGGGGGGVTAVSSYADLGDCSSMNEGAVRLVSEENQQYRCEGGEWKEFENMKSPLDGSGNQSGSTGLPFGGSNGGNGGFVPSVDMPGGMCSFESSFIESDDLCFFKSDYKTYIRMDEKCHDDGVINPDCTTSKYVTYSDAKKTVTIVEPGCPVEKEISAQQYQLACDSIVNLLKNTRLQKYGVTSFCNLNASNSFPYLSITMSIYLYAAQTYGEGPGLGLGNTIRYTLENIYYQINNGPYQLNTSQLEIADKIEEYCASSEKCDIFGDVAGSLEASCMVANEGQPGLVFGLPYFLD